MRTTIDSVTKPRSSEELEVAGGLETIEAVDGGSDVWPQIWKPIERKEAQLGRLI